MNQAAPKMTPWRVDASPAGYVGHAGPVGMSRESDHASEAAVDAITAARRTREAIIGRQLFADPAWDMLLALYAAFLAQRRLATSELVIAAGVPATTGLRWIDKLESVGLARRLDDPLDARRVWIELSSDGARQMRALFAAMRSCDLPI